MFPSKKKLHGALGKQSGVFENSVYDGYNSAIQLKNNSKHLKIAQRCAILLIYRIIVVYMKLYAQINSYHCRKIYLFSISHIYF